MNKKRIFVLSLFLFFMSVRVEADSVQLSILPDTVSSSQKIPDKKTQKGWIFGAFPSLGYDSDLGFQFGALASVFYYGDGSLYPQYMHSIYAETSWGVGGSGVVRLNYDSKYLIPNTRLSADLTYLSENMCDFFGFNGFESVYNKGWTDKADADYLTKAFYKVKRNIFRFSVDIERKLYKDFKWNGGVGILNYVVGSIDRNRINKNMAEDKQLPDTATLYDYYKNWKIIDPAEAQGGLHPYVRGGFTYDTREQLVNPKKGIWADAFLTYYAAFGEQKKYQHVNLNLGFRQYIPLLKDRIIFAYRLVYQQTIVGKSPFYLKNYHSSLFIQRAMNDAMGGSNNLRGIMRNRVVGDGFAFANIEFRFRILDFTLFKQYFYIGLNPLFDIGYIVSSAKYDKESMIENVESMGLHPNDFLTKGDSFHASAGIGLKAGWNENFILSVEWAKALQKQDGNMGLYILVGYLF